MQASRLTHPPSLCSVLRVQNSQTVGVFNAEGPPVPIPNTAVKLSSAENTCLATDWKDRSMPTHVKIPEANASGIFACVKRFRFEAGLSGPLELLRASCFFDINRMFI